MKFSVCMYANPFVAFVISTNNSSSSAKKKFLALDLDETLVHSSFQPVSNASFTIMVVIEGIVPNVYVIKRPGMSSLY